MTSSSSDGTVVSTKTASTYEGGSQSQRGAHLLSSLQAQPEEQQLWGFEENPPSRTDATRNTHLWIVKRAAETAVSNPADDPQSARVKALIQSLIVSPTDGNQNTFYDRMCSGIWDADEKEPFNAPILGRPIADVTPTYLHHFYDPINRTNWAHDDQSLQWAYLESGFAPFYETTTAYDESVNYFQETIRSWHRHHLADAGYYLGLALHFFADPTQPMHALGYINTLVDRAHGDFEEFANTLLRDSDLWPSPPPPFEVPTATDPGSIVDTAARRARQHFPALISNIIKTGASIATPPVLYPDWKSRVTGLTKSLLRDAASAAAQYLWVWATHALRGFDPNGDDKIKITGALAGYGYRSSSVLLAGVDGSGVTYERLWDQAGFRDWTGVSFRPDNATDNQHVSPIVSASGNLSTVPDGENNEQICQLTISEDGRLLETCFVFNPNDAFASDWIDRGPIRNGGGDPSQAASLVAINTNNRIDAFAISDSAQLLHAVRVQGTWRSWETLPTPNDFDVLLGPFNGPPRDRSTDAVSPLAVTYTTAFGFDVFAVSKLGFLLHTYYRENRPDSHWATESVAGFPHTRIVPGSLAAVHLKGQPSLPPHVFAMLTDGTLLHWFWTDTNDFTNNVSNVQYETLSGTTIGGGLGSSLVASSVFNSLDVFATTKDGTLIHRVYNESTGWQDWIKVGTSGRTSSVIAEPASMPVAEPVG